MKSTNKHSNQLSVALIFWFMLLPQATLIALNVRSWMLIRGEATESQIEMAMRAFSIELIAFLITFVVLVLLRRAFFHTNWLLALFSLISHSALMLFAINTPSEIIPTTIQPWILNEESVFRWSITLLMPGAFISLYSLTQSFFSSLGKSTSTLIVLTTMIGIPLMWYLGVALFQPLWMGQYSIAVSVLVGAMMVIGFLGSVIYLFDKLIHRAIDLGSDDTSLAIAALLGVIAPLAGLALNSALPFPADFQAIGVYAFTVFNGLVLTLNSKSEEFRLTRLALRCMTFPFIAYFFLVFLPFLPLSIFAILALGTGFLMLTPLALGLYQGRITLNEYRSAVAQHGKTKPLSTAVFCLALLPTYFILEAVLDKRALDTTLDYFYAHDPASASLSESQINRSSSALKQLRDRKLGVQLPFISAAYNKIVFGDMVLSDNKIESMYRLLTGESIPEPDISILGTPRRGQFGGWRPTIVPPTQETSIDKIETDFINRSSTTVRLNLRNESQDTHALYVGKLKVPEGVFITGLRLKIEDRWEAGQIFDRKTAKWIFQKITEVRRDPALLYYTSPTTLDLRVYPFPSKGTREVEIDFEFHPSNVSAISIDQQTVKLNPSSDQRTVVSSTGAVLLDLEKTPYAFVREPYLHFILDYSSSSHSNADEFARRIIDTQKRLKIDKFKVSAANITVSRESNSDTIHDTTDVDIVRDIVRGLTMNRTSGFWLEQAIAKEINTYAQNLNSANINHVPLFVAISDSRADLVHHLQLNNWRQLLPEFSGWYQHTNDELVWHPLESSHTAALGFVPTKMIALKGASKYHVKKSDEPSMITAAKDQELTVYNPMEKLFMPLDIGHNTPPPSQTWEAASELWSSYKQVSTNPAVLEQQRQTFLTESRAKSVLLPSTSLIAVERASQLEMLKRKEKQSLDNHSALDFEEKRSSEPAGWILLLGLFAYLYFQYRRQNQRRFA